MVGSYSRYAAMALQTMQAAAYRMAEKNDDRKVSTKALQEAEAAEAANRALQPSSASVHNIAPARPMSVASSPRPSSAVSEGPAAVALGLAGDAVTGVVSSVGSTVVGAGHLVGRLLTFGVVDSDEFSPQRRDRRDRG